jgi:hypothetical protein
MIHLIGLRPVRGGCFGPRAGIGDTRWIFEQLGGPGYLYLVSDKVDPGDSYEYVASNVALTQDQVDELAAAGLSRASAPSPVSADSYDKALHSIHERVAAVNRRAAEHTARVQSGYVSLDSLSAEQRAQFYAYMATRSVGMWGGPGIADDGKRVAPWLLAEAKLSPWKERIANVLGDPPPPQ